MTKEEALRIAAGVTKDKVREMTDNVVDLPVITTLDMDPDRVLQQAMGKLDDVVILGFCKDGGEYFSSSKADAAEILYRLERAKHNLMKIVDDMNDD